MPGTPAVVGGLLVLAGCAASYAMFRSLDFADLLHVSVNGQIGFCVMWFLIGVTGVLLEVIVTTRAAAKQQLVPADRPLRVAAFSLTPSVIVAMVLTVKFLLPVNAEVVCDAVEAELFHPRPCRRRRRSSTSCPSG